MTAATTNSSIVRSLAAAQRIVHLVSRNDFPVVQVVADSRMRVRVTTAHLIAAAAHDTGDSLLAVYQTVLDTDPKDTRLWNAALRELVSLFDAADIEVTY